jgi:hypothetical protein
VRVAAAAAALATAGLAAPALAGVTTTVSPAKGLELAIAGDTGNNRIAVSCAAGVVQLNGEPVESEPPCAEIAELRIDAGSGADHIDLSAVGNRQFTSWSATRGCWRWRRGQGTIA